MWISYYWPLQDTTYNSELQYQHNYEDSVLNLSGTSVINDQTSQQAEELALALQFFQVPYTFSGTIHTVFVCSMYFTFLVLVSDFSFITVQPVNQI